MDVSNLRAEPGGGTESLRCCPGRFVDHSSILSFNACTSFDSKRSSAISSSYLTQLILSKKKTYEFFSKFSYFNRDASFDAYIVCSISSIELRILLTTNYEH